MKEVSCQALDFLFREVRRTGRSSEKLFAGIPYTEAHLRNRHERIEWDVFLNIMENAARLWSPEDFIAMGGAFLRSPWLRPAALVARLLFTAKDFYRWVYTFDNGRGEGHQMFHCVEPHFTDLDEQHVQIEIRIRPGYALPPEGYFLVSQGIIEEMPRVVGMGKATVVREMYDCGARFHVTLPPGKSVLGWARKVVMWPFLVHSAARELKDANRALQERYHQLEDTRQLVQRQATQLRTAHSISQIIHGDLDVHRIVDAIAAALVTIAQFPAATVDLQCSVEGHQIAAAASAGSSGSFPELRLPILVRSEPAGTLRLSLSSEAMRTEAYELLEYVMPIIQMTIDDSLAYMAVVDYRNNLEHKVEERTTELEQARDHLARTVEDLRRAQEVRERIFANLNHEIRTPLSLMLLATRHIATTEGTSLASQSIQRLHDIEMSIGRLLNLVDGLLLLAAGQEGKIKIHPTPRDLAVLLRSAVSQWTPAAESADLSLSYDGPKHCVAPLDHAAIERVIANLLSNAVKFTPAGGSIQVALEVSESQLRVSVRDTGIGIDDEFRQRIFGRFEQGRPAVRPHSRGSGIGLSIVKELVQAHGGDVKVESSHGGGSIFILSLPRQCTSSKSNEHGATPLLSSPSVELASPAVPEAVEVLEPDFVPEATLLVAEDDGGLRAALGRVLGDRYRVVLTSDGLAALDAAKKHLPDLLISDVGMPGMDGLELTKRFRQLDGLRLAPVILLTAYGTTQARLSGFQAGAVDYLMKPFDPEELCARVRSQLERRNLALRLHENEKLAALGVMSAGLAHELRNPANAVLNAVAPLKRLLPKEALDSETATGQLLEVIELGANQIATLSRQLLGFSHTGELTKENVDLRRLVSAATALVAHHLKHIRFEQALEPSTVVNCTPPLVIQVLTNMLENAAQAAGPGGWVRLSAEQADEALVVRVADSGPGVPRPLRERIFDPFFTTKPPGSGTGLGLPTCRSIAEQHNGVFILEDSSVGAVFRLELPLAPANAQNGAARRVV